jgi:polysaccharide pyruvyl transferase WcaK-like protein
MKQTTRKVALLHHTGCGNLGDDAIIDVVIENIRQRWADAEIAVFSMNPLDTAEKHGITTFAIRRYTWNLRPKAAVPNRSAQPKFAGAIRRAARKMARVPVALFSELAFLWKAYRKISSFDLMVVSGGGQLTERGGPWSFPYALFVWSWLAKLAGVKVAFLSVGAGPLNHPMSKWFIVNALRAADYISLRDKQSQDLIVKLGFRGASHVFPDNAYSLSVPASRKRMPGQPPLVGVAPMPYPFSDLLKFPENAGQIQNDLVQKLATFTSLLARDGYAVELFGSDLRADPPVIDDLRQALLNNSGIAMPEYVSPQSMGDLLQSMSAMDYVITCRFHCVLFAHLLNKPVLAIAHHPKVTHLMEDLGLSDYCVAMDSFDPVELAGKFAALVENTQSVRAAMAAKATAYTSRIAEQFDQLFPRCTPAPTMASRETEAVVIR